MSYPGRLRSIGLVARKELRSGVRDRQTLIYAVVLPLALYPTLFWVMLQGFTYFQSRDAKTVTVVEVAGPLPVEEAELRHALIEPEDEGQGPLEIAGFRGAITEEEARTILDEGEVHLVLGFQPGGGPATLWFDSTESRSTLARERTRSRLADFAFQLREEGIEAAGETWAGLAPATMEPHDLASERDLGGYILSMVLPMTFVIMAMMGAMIPAIDLTAGEKERGTAETTWLLPVDRASVHLGKVLAVSCAAFIATTLNLTGMALAAEHLLASLKQGLTIEIPWQAFFAIAPLTLVFLFTTSAFLVAMASLTKSFKQGQSLMGVVQMLFIMPAVIAIMPGIELSLPTACVPVLQTVLAFKAALQTAEPGATAPLGLYAVVALTQLIYASIALWFSLRLTSQESLLEGGAKAGDLLRLVRSAGAPR